MKLKIVCDESNNSPEDVEKGVVNVDVSVNRPTFARTITMNDPTVCNGCGAHYTQVHREGCPVVAAARRLRDEHEKRRAEEHAKTFEARIDALGVVPRFKVRSVVFDQPLGLQWIVEDRAATTLCMCESEELAKIIAEALDAVYYDED